MLAHRVCNGTATGQRSWRQACHPKPFSSHSKRALRTVTRAEANAAEDVDLEDQVELFMKRQAELESGAAFVRSQDPAAILGADVVPEEDAKMYCREILDILKTLKRTRDMSVNEARLIIAIEDPRARERRSVGIEDERGVSRDEMAAALMEVAEGRMPRDRIALKCVWDDMTGWPFLSVDTPAGSASSDATATAASVYEELNDDSIVKPYIMGKDARQGDKPQTLADMLPDWVGYGALYGISSIPALLAVGAILVLFYNSLK